MAEIANDSEPLHTLSLNGADLQKVSDGQAEAVEMEEKVINEGE